MALNFLREKYLGKVKATEGRGTWVPISIAMFTKSPSHL
jgi:hypothetical protein